MDRFFIIGQRIDSTLIGNYAKQVYNERKQSRDKVRGCNHPKTENPFCAYCGKSMFVEYDELENIEDIIETIFDDLDTRLDSLGSKYLRVEDSESWFIGIGERIENWESVSLSQTKYNDHYTEALLKVKELLEPYKLWDETKFSLWTGILDE